MKTSTIALLICASMIALSYAGTDTLVLTDSDSGPPSNIYPIAVTGTASSTINTGAIQVTGIAQGATSGVYVFTFANGMPLNSYFQLNGAAAGTDGVTGGLTTNGQPVIVTQGSSATVSSQTAVTPAAYTAGIVVGSSTATCGITALDGVNGVVYTFVLAGAATTGTCFVNVAQATAIIGFVGTNFTKSSFDTTTTQQTAVTNGLATAGGSITSTRVVITGTAAATVGGTCIVFFQVNPPSGTSDLPAVQTAFNTAIQNRTLSISGANITSANAATLAPTQNHNSSSPLTTQQTISVQQVAAQAAAALAAQAAAALAAAVKSQTRVMMFAGVFSTAVATLFGLLV